MFFFFLHVIIKKIFIWSRDECSIRAVIHFYLNCTARRVILVTVIVFRDKSKYEQYLDTFKYKKSINILHFFLSHYTIYYTYIFVSSFLSLSKCPITLGVHITFIQFLFYSYTVELLCKLLVLIYANFKFILVFTHYIF